MNFKRNAKPFVSALENVLYFFEIGKLFKMKMKQQTQFNSQNETILFSGTS